MLKSVTYETEQGNMKQKHQTCTPLRFFYQLRSTNPPSEFWYTEQTFDNSAALVFLAVAATVPPGVPPHICDVELGPFLSKGGIRRRNEHS